MTNTLNLTLPDDLRTFIDHNSGDGTPYALPSEFVCAVLLEKKERLAAAAMREAIIAGYEDAIAGRVHAYDGDLRTLMKRVRSNH